MEAGTPHPIRHELRTLPKSFAAILNRFKKHEVRVNDRDLLEGDEVYLLEWNPVTPTGCAGWG
jgi:hypothetical protein